MSEENHSVEIEGQGMTDEQFHGIIRMIIRMVKDDMPKEKLLEYLEELILSK